VTSLPPSLQLLGSLLLLCSQSSPDDLCVLSLPCTHTCTCTCAHTDTHMRMCARAHTHTHTHSDMAFYSVSFISLCIYVSLTFSCALTCSPHHIGQDVVSSTQKGRQLREVAVCLGQSHFSSCSSCPTGPQITTSCGFKRNPASFITTVS